VGLARPMRGSGGSCKITVTAIWNDLFHLLFGMKVAVSKVHFASEVPSAVWNEGCCKLRIYNG
jgi:hypothetical protein